MGLRLKTLLLLAAVIGMAVSGIVPRVRRNMVRGRPVRGFLQKSMLELPAVDAQIPTQYFNNEVDHFDASNTKTFKQRYWSNKQWYKPGGPVFFMLGGESEESAGWVSTDQLEWTQMAKEQGAWVFLMEHRYYGESRPTADMSTDNLIYLSSAQALEDYAAFIQGMNSLHNLSGAKWVTFGGSYSGALAAWMRLKHPELVFAAVGSSGPVQAEVDFVEYLEVVKNSISTVNADCGASVSAGFNQVAQLLKTASGRQSLKTTFHLCDDLDITNDLQIKTFWETVYSPYMEVVQYSGDNAGSFRNRLNIQNAICRYHEKSTSTMSKMQAVNNYFNMENGYFGCNDINYNNFIDFMQDTSYGQAQDSRAWVWQTCTEFGYYQSTDSTTAGPWYGGNGNLPISFYVDECTAIYGQKYNYHSVAQAVAKTNAYYGGRDNFNTTQVLLPNGIVDPWHALGKLTSSDSSVVPVIITGTAHCADMYTPAADDLQSLKDARKTIRTTLYSWLKSPINV